MKLFEFEPVVEEDASNFSSGDHWVQQSRTICAILVEHVKLI